MNLAFLKKSFAVWAIMALASLVFEIATLGWIAWVSLIFMILPAAMILVYFLHEQLWPQKFRRQEFILPIGMLGLELLNLVWFVGHDMAEASRSDKFVVLDIILLSSLVTSIQMLVGWNESVLLAQARDRFVFGFKAVGGIVFLVVLIGLIGTGVMSLLSDEKWDLYRSSESTISTRVAVIAILLYCLAGLSSGKRAIVRHGVFPGVMLLILVSEMIIKIGGFRIGSNSVLDQMNFLPVTLILLALSWIGVSLLEMAGWLSWESRLESNASDESDR